MLITHAHVFKPAVLTAILRANQVITSAEEVTNLTQLTTAEIPHGHVHTFAVQYKNFRTQRHAPDHVSLKLLQGAYAEHELRFYQRLLPVMKRKADAKLLRFPAFYDGYYDESSQKAHVLLDDLSREFKPSAENMPPSKKHQEQIMDTLAYLHAIWWEHPLLDSLAPLPNPDDIAITLAQYQTKLEQLQQRFGQYLAEKYLDTLAIIASKIPIKREQAITEQKHLTVIHGNLHPQNLIYSPIASYIINWQDWRISFATDDLAQMIPFYWSQDLRDFQEMALLKRYHGTLLKQGVTDYSWDDLLHNYKVSLSQIIGGMLARWTRLGHTSGDWRKMEGAMDSFLAMDGLSVYN